MALWLSLVNGMYNIQMTHTLREWVLLFFTPLLHPAGWNENMAGAATVDLSVETAYWGRQSNKWERTWILRLMEPPWQPCMIEGKEISTLCKLSLP